RVQHQVQNALLEQVAVDVHRWEVRRGEPLDLDVALAGRRSEEINHSRDDAVEGGRLDVKFLHACEAEEIRREIDEFLALAGESGHAVERAAFAWGLRVLEIFGEQLEVER